MSLSVLVLTRNEAANLPGCLESVRWCDDVVVLDSLSTDSTQQVARQHGARLVESEFDDFAGQRNFAIDTIAFKHPWVFHLDADERFTADLHEECMRAVAKDECSGFLVPSKMILWGRWLKHAAAYPVYQMRLMKLGEVRFRQHGHGQREFEARRGIGRLSSPYLHNAFSKGMHEWLERHNQYSTLEARAALAQLESARPGCRGLLSLDPTTRRRALKDVSLRLPLRPCLKFAYLYFLRMGFLDGREGLTYCALQSIYEYMICLKQRELARRRAGGSD